MRKTVTVAILLFVAATGAIAFYRIQRRGEMNDCLDSGGTWDAGRRVCVRLPEPEVSGDAYSMLTSLFSTPQDLSAIRAASGQIMKLATYATPAGAQTDFISYQIIGKTLRVYAEYDALRGNYPDAVQQLATLAYVGELLSRDWAPTYARIGSGIKLLALGGLTNVLLNMPDTTATESLAWAALDDLESRTNQNLKAEYSLFDKLRLATDLKEMETAAAVAKTKLRLLRAAKAARHVHDQTHAFPTVTGFTPLRGGTTESDPFSSARNRLKSEIGKDSLRIWSVGPDDADDRGLLPYDPTNGIPSGGDIYLEVPEERAYILPELGKPIRTRDIPTSSTTTLFRDPFADRVGTPYSVSSGSPPAIYSFGPDADQSNHSWNVPEPEYDPTNGLTSNGDIVLWLKE